MTIVGKNEIYNWEDLVGPFLVHNLLGPRPPPPLPPLLILPWGWWWWKFSRRELLTAPGTAVLLSQIHWPGAPAIQTHLCLEAEDVEEYESRSAQTEPVVVQTPEEHARSTMVTDIQNITAQHPETYDPWGQGAQRQGPG